ncbi:MAG: carbon-nitrogen hydrolase family protein, partial [Gemmataceae bacterium]
MRAPARSLLLALAASTLVGPGRADQSARTPGPDDLPPGWSARSQRDEIRPAFAYAPTGGPKRAGAIDITHDQRAGLQGWVEKEFPVTGGEWVRFGVVRRTRNVADPRRSCLVRVRWQDDAGKMVPAAVPEARIKELGHVPSAEPEHPADGATDADGWTQVSGVYRVPPRATKAVVELHLQWAPGGRV